MGFDKLSRNEKERILMPILIRLLQNLGGKATRNELRTEIKTSVDEIPEQVVDEIKVRKNGRFYQPFNFLFNFSIINLEMAGYLRYPQKGMIALTEKGRMCDISLLNVDEDIYTYSIPGWKERKNQKKNKENVSIVNAIGLKNDIEQESVDISEQWKQKLKDSLFSMPPKKFELFCRALIRKMGVDIDEKKGVAASRDGGIDGYGYIVSDDFRTSRIAIQAKRWKETQRVSAPDIDQFAGAMMYNNAEFGIFITTTSFSRDAIERARSGQRAITLIDGDKIVELVEKYQLYIKPVTTFQLDAFYTEEN